jgi:hypothetical protein
VLHKADQPMADQFIVSPPLPRGQRAKPLRHLKSNMTLMWTAPHVARLFTLPERFL